MQENDSNPEDSNADPQSRVITQGGFNAAPCYAVHVDGVDVISPALQKQLDKFAALLAIKELIRTGNAAVMPNGNVVDRLQHPEAVPMKPHNVGTETRREPGTAKGDSK